MEAGYSKNRTGVDSSAIAEADPRLRRELANLKRLIYANLEAWQTVQVSRASTRPPRRDLHRPDLRSSSSRLHGDRAWATTRRS